jgi:cytochrome c oxidase assembly protein Cox11
MYDYGVAFNITTFFYLILGIKYADVPTYMNVCILFMRIVQKIYNNGVENVCNYARIYKY